MLTPIHLLTTMEMPSNSIETDMWLTARTIFTSNKATTTQAKIIIDNILFTMYHK